MTKFRLLYGLLPVGWTVGWSTGWFSCLEATGDLNGGLERDRGAGGGARRAPTREKTVSSTPGDKKSRARWVIQTGLDIGSLLLYIQEVLTISYSKLLYKLGNHFLDSQYV